MSENAAEAAVSAQRQTPSTEPPAYQKFFKKFQSAVSVNKMHLPGGYSIAYYDYGPRDKTAIPLVCLHGTCSGPQVFYKQIVSLAARGQRVIALSVPNTLDHYACVNLVGKFLDSLELMKPVHIWGVGLGGFIALLFSCRHGRRVASLVLTNAFCDSTYYFENCGGGYLPVSSLQFLPAFVLKQNLLQEIEHGMGVADTSKVDAVDFIVDHMERLSQDDLACRLTLRNTHAKVEALPSKIKEHQHIVTLLDTMDRAPHVMEMSQQLYDLLPEARQALLKDGGDFPHLSRSEEVNLHLLVHLQRFTETES